MEENTVELFDYLRVIWKRKILIIALILVGIVVGVVVVVVKISKIAPVTSYHCTDVSIKIGKKVQLVPSGGISSTVVSYIDSPKKMVETIPLKYGFIIKKTPEYHLDVKQISNLALIKLTLKGPDRGTERALKELIDILIDEHRIKTNDSVIAYKSFMKKLELDIENLKEDMALLEASIEDMKKQEGVYLLHLDLITKAEKSEGDRSAFLNMLYLKTVDKEDTLHKCKEDLRNTQMKLYMHQITLGNLEEYKTEMVGEMQSTTIVSKRNEKRFTGTIVIAGFAGLIISLFIAFFKEYVDESKLRRKGK